MSDRIRWGMVGGGQGAFIGGVHRMAARIDDRYALVAAAPSSDAARARASGSELRLDPSRVYSDYRQMARAEAARPDGIEVVSIVTPNHLHHDVACAFLDAGIHVMCDKPLTRTLAEADSLVERARASGRLFGVTFTYSGYPMVRHAREMVRQGKLGDIRIVQVEYAQDWLAQPIEEAGQKQAEWRTDPQRSGEGGCIGDIGTHAFHLASFVTGLEVTEVSAELTRFVEGRRVDDDAQVRLRFANGARGLLWASQVATGAQNGLALRVYGTTGSILFRQETPDELWYSPFGEPTQRLTRGGPALSQAAAFATRVPSGHPEGYLEAFAQLYRDMADQIDAHRNGTSADPLGALLPDVIAGARGIQFVDASLRSSREACAWVRLDAGRWT